MNENTPLVSIILPIHNNAAILAACLKSLISQTYKRFEIIAIDDKSSDNSLKTLRKFQKQDKRVKIYKNVKQYGIRVTINRGIKRAHGDCLIFMNPKDTCSNARLEKQITYLLEHPKVAAVGSQCLFVDKQNQTLGKTEFPEGHQEISGALLPGMSLQFETVMIYKTRLPKDAVWFEASALSSLYHNLCLKIIKYSRFATLPEYLYFKRDRDAVDTNRVKHALSFAKAWLKAAALLSKRPSLRYFFTPLIKAA